MVRYDFYNSPTKPLPGTDLRTKINFHPSMDK